MASFEYQELLNSIQIWGYPLIFLLMILEGPIATLGAAFLASLGFFNIFIIFLLSLIGDVISDIILYFTGFFSKKLLPRNGKFYRSNSNLREAIKKSFQKKGAQIIFFTKATTGLCYITFTLAGMVRLSLKKFLLYSFLGGLIWSGFLTISGYYFGWLAEEMEKYIKFSGWIIFFSAVVVLSLIMLIKKTHDIKKFKKINNQNDQKK